MRNVEAVAVYWDMEVGDHRRGNYQFAEHPPPRTGLPQGKHEDDVRQAFAPNPLEHFGD